MTNNEFLDASLGCKTIKECLEVWEPLNSYATDGKLELGNPHALLEYNKAILYLLYKLKLIIPFGNLVPSVCVRNTYLAYLIKKFPDYNTYLDLGTGASALLALILAKQGKQVIATEIDQQSLNFGNNNIKLNKLESQITILASQGGIIESVLTPEQISKIQVAVTYPPFYPNDRPGYTSKKKRGFKGTNSELFSGDDGMEFIRKYIREGCKHRIPVVTLMVHKSFIANDSVNLFGSNYSVDIVSVKAGNRKRFVVIGELMP